MDTKDLMKIPQLFAIKEGGIINPHYGMSHDRFAVQTVYLLGQHNVVGCDEPSCDCLDKAWAHHCPEVEIVPVCVIETAPEGAVN